MTLYLMFKNAFNITRSLSVFLTVLITIERYIVIASPFQSKFWLDGSTHPWKARVPIIIVFSTSILLNIVWIIKTNLVKNHHFDENFDESLDIDEFERFPYLIERNEWVGRSIQWTILFVDYLLPFPVLLIFTGLLYKSV